MIQIYVGMEAVFHQLHAFLLGRGMKVVVIGYSKAVIISK